jgi:hypothetical protein
VDAVKFANKVDAILVVEPDRCVCCGRVMLFIFTFALSSHWTSRVNGVHVHSREGV